MVSWSVRFVGLSVGWLVMHLCWSGCGWMCGFDLVGCERVCGRSVRLDVVLAFASGFSIWMLDLQEGTGQNK